MYFKYLWANNPFVQFAVGPEAYKTKWGLAMVISRNRKKKMKGILVIQASKRVGAF